MAAVNVFLVLVTAWCQAVASQYGQGVGLGIPVRSEEGRRLRPTGFLEVASSLSATLDAVHTRRLEEHVLVHVHHPVERPPEGPSGQQASWASERETVRGLLRMSFAAYGKIGSYSEEVLRPILNNSDSVYGPHVDTFAKEVAEEAAHEERVLGEFKGTYEPADAGTGIDSSGLDAFGVHALEFTVRGVGKVLAFRGTTSTGDFANMMLWITDWARRKMSARQKHAWLVEAGLPWSAELETQRSQLPGLLSRAGVYAGGWLRVSSLTTSMRASAISTGSLIDPEKVVKTGYWEFTKAIGEHVRKNLKEGEQLILTGHSAGGTRAALVSMMFEKKYGERLKTVTFAAPGGQCFTRELSFSGAALTDDVDPYISHSQITDYAHPVDIYALMDYGFGKRCTYGLSDIATSRAKKYCEKVFGHRGAELLVAGTWGVGKNLADNFGRCRYFTHWVNAIERDLSKDAYLKEDGTTDGGCAVVETIPKGDPDNKCRSLSGTESCSDELSCQSCQVSSASTSCYWSVSSGKCVGARPKHGTTGYIGPKDVCPETAARVAPGEVSVSAGVEP